MWPLETGRLVLIMPITRRLQSMSIAPPMRGPRGCGPGLEGPDEPALDTAELAPHGPGILRPMSRLSWTLLLFAATCRAQVETGTHWAGTGDFVTLRNIGYEFVVTTVTNNPADWKNTFDAAERAGLRLVVGLSDHSQYRLSGDAWTVSPTGETFIRYAASRTALVKAIFLFNEPYWVDPWTGQTSICGVLSAGQLRGLRNAVRAIWPAALVYHDIGAPSYWAPGGQVNRDYPCIGNKYADQRGVTDFAGIWFYPFERTGYRKDKGLAVLRTEVEFTRKQMAAEPVIAGQSFICKACEEATRWPTAEEIQDWNCALRSLGPQAISWYVWKQSLYNDYLSNHPDHWSRTTARACVASPATPKPALDSVASAAAMDSALPVAPGSILSIFGDQLAGEVRVAAAGGLPRQLGETTVLINGLAAPLYFVAPTQINAQVPWELPVGDATLVVKRGEALSGSLRLRVAETAPALFTWSQNGQGAAVAVDGLTNELVDVSRPASSGQYVVLYGTGLGRMASAVETGQGALAANAAVRPVTVTLGAVRVPVLYAGAAPGFAGLAQINIQVPAGLPPGAQRLVLVQGGQQSNVVTLPLR